MFCTLVQSILEHILDVKSWMTFNKLKLNDKKTEVMAVSSPFTSASVQLPESIAIRSSQIQSRISVSFQTPSLQCTLKYWASSELLTPNSIVSAQYAITFLNKRPWLLSLHTCCPDQTIVTTFSIACNTFLYCL